MSDSPKPSFWCIHLSTIIVLMFTIGAVLILNAFIREWRDGPTIPLPNGWTGSGFVYYGWPCYYKRELHSQPYLPKPAQWYPDALRNNITFGVIILCGIGAAFELGRRRWAALLECRPRLRPSVFGFIFAATAVLWLNMRSDHDGCISSGGDFVYGWPGFHIYIDDHGFGERWDFHQLAWNVLAAAGCVVISVYLANRLTRGFPSRPFQYHLSTFLLLAIGSSGYLLLNILPSQDEWHTAHFGWPFVVHSRGIFEGLNGAYERTWLPRFGFALNLLLYGLGVMVFTGMCEWIIRRREAKKQ